MYTISKFRTLHNTPIPTIYISQRRIIIQLKHNRLRTAVYYINSILMLIQIGRNPEWYQPNNPANRFRLIDVENETYSVHITNIVIGIVNIH